MPKDNLRRLGRSTVRASRTHSIPCFSFAAIMDGLYGRHVTEADDGPARDVVGGRRVRSDMEPVVVAWISGGLGRERLAVPRRDGAEDRRAYVTRRKAQLLGGAHIPARAERGTPPQRRRLKAIIQGSLQFQGALDESYLLSCGRKGLFALNCVSPLCWYAMC